MSISNHSHTKKNMTKAGQAELKLSRYRLHNIASGVKGTLKSVLCACKLFAQECTAARKESDTILARWD